MKHEKARLLSELDKLPDDALINDPEARSYLNISRTTFWRGWGGIYPAPIKLGKMNRWRIGGIRELVRGGLT
jgi:predicted DNA-binding transcriptional regulator AlpA